MSYTDEQLHKCLAKMLPDFIAIDKEGDFFWHSTDRKYNLVLDTELLHICWMIEEALNPEQQVTYLNTLYKVESVENNLKWRIHPDCHATWQQRTVALAKVKGIEI